MPLETQDPMQAQPAIYRDERCFGRWRRATRSACTQRGSLLLSPSKEQWSEQRTVVHEWVRSSVACPFLSLPVLARQIALCFEEAEARGAAPRVQRRRIGFD